MEQPIQLTFGNYGHTLHHCQVFSPDNQWIVYDTRNDDTQIGTTTRIERVNVVTKEIEVLYEVVNPNEFGPGVGAATYSPTEDKVIFIHGLDNATKDKPYGIARRSAVAIDVSFPNVPIHLDARNVIEPYTKGALRGGTHSHSWHPNGELISFTYNDEVLADQNLPNERAVGVMFPQKVIVSSNNSKENFSGEMFSVIISKLVERAKNGSDEIEKAFDECWLGNKRELIFQGWVRDDDGNRKTEIFHALLPEDLTKSDNVILEGTKTQFPSVPKGVVIKRVTYTPKGISTFRHWLRSDSTGEIIYFLMEDDNLCTNIFELNLNSYQIRQVTFHTSSIYSPINLSPDGQYLVYFCEDFLCYSSISDSSNIKVLDVDIALSGIPNFDKNGQVIYYNKYVKEKSASKFLQIFKIKV